MDPARPTSSACCHAVPYWFYTLPEFDWPEAQKAQCPANGLMPAEAVQQYLEEYTAHFNLSQRIHFSTEVTSIDQAQGESAGPGSLLACRRCFGLNTEAVRQADIYS